MEILTTDGARLRVLRMGEKGSGATGSDLVLVEDACGIRRVINLSQIAKILGAYSFPPIDKAGERQP